MQTIAHDFLSVPSHMAKAAARQRPFRTIALLACVALAMSACKTVRGPEAETKDSRELATYTHLEPEAAAKELFDKGQALIRQGKKQEAITVLNELDRRFGQDPRRSVRAILAQALSLKAEAAATPTESLAIQAEINRRYGGDIDSAQRRQIITAMFSQAAALGKEGNFSAAIPIYKEIEQSYRDNDDKSWGAWAIFYQGDLQRQLRNPKAAVAAYERLDQRFSQESDPAVRTIVADGLSKKGETLAEQGDVRAAIAAYEEVARRYAEDRDAGFRLRAVRALYAKGVLLGKQGTGEDPGNEFQSRPTGDTAAAVAVYDDIVLRFGRDRDSGIRNAVGATLLKKSETLRLSGDDRGSIAIYDEIVGRFGNDDVQASRVLVATTLFRKGQTLGRLEGPSPAAIAAFDELIRRFAPDTTNPNLRKIVGQAVLARQKLIADAAPMNDN
ncbi:MAG: tetratricopeptide repeat protein [Proteobacteria bacterium]|jgi:tetratricopeptide (TPR) repeat protein|nr:tetratricopeptide repeat protein [Pseudomonadota bacterium]